VLAKKPGALRNGDPFRNWDLPLALAQIRRRLAGHDDGDRQFVDILTEVARPGSTLSRRPVPRRSQPDCSAATSCSTSWRGSAMPIRPLRSQPRRRWRWRSSRVADCARYDQLRSPPLEEAYPRGLGPGENIVERHKIIELMGQLSWPACAPPTTK